MIFPKCKICGGETFMTLDERGVYPVEHPKKEPFLTCMGCDLPVEKCICMDIVCPLCKNRKKYCTCDEW